MTEDLTYYSLQFTAYGLQFTIYDLQLMVNRIHQCVLRVYLGTLCTIEKPPIQSRAGQGRVK